MQNFKNYLSESPFLDQLNAYWDEYTWPAEAIKIKKHILDKAKSVGMHLEYDPKRYLQIPIAKEVVKKIHGNISRIPSDKTAEYIESQIQSATGWLEQYYHKHPDVVSTLTLFIKALNKYKSGKDVNESMDFLKEYNPQNNDASDVFQFVEDKKRELQTYVDDGNKRDTTGQPLVAEDENFKIYKISNKKQAEAPCWKNYDGTNRFCISQDANIFVKKYGGYPFFMITRKLSSGNEKLYGVLMPGVLQTDLSQGIRNAANTEGLKPDEIRPLLPLLQNVAPDSYEYLNGL